MQGYTECIIFEAGQKTVMFAPILSILFVAARMRALQLTKSADGTTPPMAGPQSWAQDGMFLATWSVLVQVTLAIIVPIALGTWKPVMDEMEDARGIIVYRPLLSSLSVTIHMRAKTQATWKGALQAAVKPRHATGVAGGEAPQPQLWH